MLSKNYDLPPVSTINQYLTQKKQTLEQAFGFENRPWSSRYDELEKLISKDGYRFVGERVIPPESSLAQLQNILVVFAQEILHEDIKIYR